MGGLLSRLKRTTRTCAHHWHVTASGWQCCHHRRHRIDRREREPATGLATDPTSGACSLPPLSQDEDPRLWLPEPSTTLTAPSRGTNRRLKRKARRSPGRTVHA